MTPNNTPFTVLELKGIPEEEKRTFTAILLVLKVNQKEARNGSPFLTIEMGDATGSFSSTCFSGNNTFDILSRNDIEGEVVALEGQTDTFNGKFAPRILHIRVLGGEEKQAWLPKLIESSPEDPNALWSELEGFIASIQHEKLRKTVEAAFREHADALKVSAAAISMHHAYRHGLLEHTVHVTRLAQAVLPLYPEVSRDLTLAGSLLHDIGKVLEYDGDRVVKKTQAGILQGHVILGYRIVRKAALQSQLDESLMERLEHIILSHQGALEWGAPVLAATPEAILVSLVDNLDAKLGMAQKALRSTPPHEPFSEFIPGLQSKLMVAPA